jgi:peptidylprolyl isomerase
MKYEKGIVAMANRGPNTNGSQFFIMHEEYPLPYQYTIFGKVLNGLDVVDAIGNVQTGENDKPNEDVVIYSIKITNG